MLELDQKYVFHVPLYKYINSKLIPINNVIVDDFINQLNQNEYHNLYITTIKGYYKSRCFDELLITIFTSKELIEKQNQKYPDIIFKQWFKENNNILEQESIAYEFNNKMFILEI